MFSPKHHNLDPAQYYTISFRDTPQWKKLLYLTVLLAQLLTKVSSDIVNYDLRTAPQRLHKCIQRSLFRVSGMVLYDLISNIALLCSLSNGFTSQFAFTQLPFPLPVSMFLYTKEFGYNCALRGIFIAKGVEYNSLSGTSLIRRIIGKTFIGLIAFVVRKIDLSSKRRARFGSTGFLPLVSSKI